MGGAARPFAQNDDSARRLFSPPASTERVQRFTGRLHHLDQAPVFGKARQVERRVSRDRLLDANNGDRLLDRLTMVAVGARADARR